MLEQSTIELENTISDLEQKSNVKDEGDSLSIGNHMISSAIWNK